MNPPSDQPAVAVATAPAPPTKIERFSRAERVAHWVNAALFLVTIGTGAMFQFGIGQSIVTDRALARVVHIVAGFGIIAAFAISLLGRYGTALRRDVRRLSHWTTDDRRWLTSRGRDRRVRLGKFNPGQKLNATFVAAAAVVLAGSGSIMYWNRPFSTDLRTGADFVHGWFAYGVVASIVGHVFMAVRDREAMQGITNGSVSVDWARDHRPRWYAEAQPVPAGEP